MQKQQEAFQIKEECGYINFKRLRRSLPVFIGISVVLCFLNLQSLYTSAVFLRNEYRKHLYAQEAYVATMLLLLLIDFIYQKQARKGSFNETIRRRYTRFFIGAVSIGSSILLILSALFNQATNAQVAPVYTGLAGLGGLLLLSPVQSFLSILAVEVFFLAGLWVFQADWILLQGQIVDALVMGGVVWLVSLIQYRSFERNIQLRRELKKLNEGLEEQVQSRTEQLLQSKRLADVGMHTAQIVHNLKNPMTVILGFSEILLWKMPGDEMVLKIKNAGLKLQDIVKNLLSTTRIDSQIDQKSVALVLDSLLKEELEFLKVIDDRHKDEVKIDVVLNAPEKILAVASHLRQLFNNLVQNALDAMHGIKEPVLTIHSEIILINEKKWVQLSISDTGEGISKENLSKIFDPFYSTKLKAPDASGKPVGTGLGLPYVKRVIESYRGVLDVKSEVGKGTKFTIIFPVVE